jgi:hypothetical protein
MKMSNWREKDKVQGYAKKLPTLNVANKRAVIRYQSVLWIRPGSDPVGSGIIVSYLLGYL